MMSTPRSLPADATPARIEASVETTRAPSPEGRDFRGSAQQTTRNVSPPAISRVSTRKPLVTLTVDDGWSRRSEIMQTLLDLGVPAVFFLTAQAVARDEGFLRAAVGNGFEIGNHTTTHRNLSSLSRVGIESELSGMDQLYRRAAGAQVPMRFFRAPYGALSTDVLDASNARAYRAIQWDVSTLDWTGLDTSGIARSVTSNARPGSIILSHFNARCLEALPGIIAGVRAKGLDFAPLSALVAESERSADPREGTTAVR